ncbi:MAG: PKD domain-containing protein, partial [Actinomycetota bacterium]|nr:PKD domain-containing protein [Actinomycetota bacterium]
MGLSLGFAAAPALASGPGIQLFSERAGTQWARSGAQIAAAADVRSRTYTLRSNPSGDGQKLTLTGLSIRGLLQMAGFDPDRVRFIAITRADGSRATLKRADFASSHRFPEGPALVTNEGSRTRFLRPVRGPGDTNARDSIVSSTAAGPLDINVEGGALLPVRARATPRRTNVGRTVRLRASIDFKPPGATFTYEWDFGDGSDGATGVEVTHSYRKEGSFHARVNVEGRGGTGAVCEDFCGNGAGVNVRIGEGQTSPRPDTRPGSANANPNGTGTSGTGSGAGGSGSGTGADRGSDADAGPEEGRTTRDRGEPAPRVDAGTAITGILLANSPTALKNSVPALRRAGGQSSATRAAREGAKGGGTLGGSVALTLVLIMLGALYERRRGT